MRCNALLFALEKKTLSKSAIGINIVRFSPEVKRKKAGEGIQRAKATAGELWYASVAEWNIAVTKFVTFAFYQFVSRQIDSLRAGIFYLNSFIRA